MHLIANRSKTPCGVAFCKDAQINNHKESSMDNNEIKKHTTRQEMVIGLSFIIGLILSIITFILAARLFSTSGPEANAPALLFFPFLILLADPLGLIMAILSIVYLKKNYHKPSTLTLVLGVIGAILCSIPILLTAIMFVGNYSTYNNSWDFFFL